MIKIKKHYEKLWKSLIRPQRYPYSEEDLGGSFLIFDNSFATRMDFKLKNTLNEEFYLSLYIPCDEEKNLTFEMNYIIYAHTHNGSRTEGLHLVEDFIEKNLGVAVFDFRANGYSSGKYVTLGWFEALDLNEVVRFLKFEAKANSICIWGRSMGASSSIFFLSQKYRNIINRAFKIQKRNKVDWVSEKFIDCIILDSCFNYLTKSVHNMVNSKTNKVPSWLINMIISILQNKIRKKTGISISKINPADFVKSIKIPFFAICGDKDELVSQRGFYETFNNFGSRIKNIKIFRGNHVEERPPHINECVLNFIIHIFKLKKNYMSNRQSQKKRKSSKISIFGNDRDVSYLNYTHAKLTINETNLNDKKKTTNFVKNKIIPKRKNVEKKKRENKYNDLKKLLKHSVSFISEDKRSKVLDKKNLENNFSIITEEEKKLEIEIPSQFKIDIQIDNYIKQQKIPEKNINNLRKEKINKKSYLRGLSFQIKNSTLKNRFRLNNNLAGTKIKSKNPPLNLKKKFQDKLEKDQKKPQIITSQKKIYQNSNNNIYVPEYRSKNPPVNLKNNIYYNENKNSIKNLSDRNSYKSISEQNSYKDISNKNSLYKNSITNIINPNSNSSKRLYRPNEIIDSNLYHRSQSPSIINQSPHKINQSPHRINQSPSRINQSPSRINQSPNRINQSPSRINQSPSRINQSPKRINEIHNIINENHNIINENPGIIRSSEYKFTPIIKRKTSYVKKSPNHSYRKNFFPDEFLDDDNKRDDSRRSFVVNEVVITSNFKSKE